MSWATPLPGLAGNPERFKPLLRRWGKVKPSVDEGFCALSPHVGATDRVVYGSDATFRFAQAKLEKIEKATR